MIICNCHAVSDRHIREVVAAGARSTTAVGKACGAGTCCGSCKSQIGDIIRAEAARRRACSHGSEIVSRSPWLATPAAAPREP